MDGAEQTQSEILRYLKRVYVQVGSATAPVKLYNNKRPTRMPVTSNQSEA